MENAIGSSTNAPGADRAPLTAIYAPFVPSNQAGHNGPLIIRRRGADNYFREAVND